MKTPTVIYYLLIAGMLQGCINLSAEKTQPERIDKTGILVVAPDRGFMGNEESRQAFSNLNHPHKQLVFITDLDSKKYLATSIAKFTQADVNDITVLPLFISEQRPVWKLASTWLLEDFCINDLHCQFSTPFGESYLAVDLLSKSLQSIAEPASKDVVIIGYGAESEESAEAMNGDWQQLVNWTSQEGKFKSVKSRVWLYKNSEQQEEELKELAARPDTVLLTFHLGKKLDSMMNFDASLQRWVLRGIKANLQTTVIDSNIIGMWLQRETNRSQIHDKSDLGIIVHAHGSDFHWNQTMRDALESLQSQYTIEFAFSMADKPSLENALLRLQNKGKKGAIIVRVFGRKSSFQKTIEKLVGIDVESNPIAHHHTMHSGHSMGGSPILTPLIVTSVGGLEDHSLFAEALLDRARNLSKDPKNETVILVAHGSGNDKTNDAWVNILKQIKDKMLTMDGEKFRAIKYATWREDWPDKRQVWISRVREMVKIAQENNGKAIVIPARTNRQGPENKFLAGLDYRLGEGFAPHPLFARWVESQIQQGINALVAKDDNLLSQN